MIGVLTGGQINPVMIMRNSLRLTGIYVGSQAMFRSMNRAFEAAALEPVIDQTFGFENAHDAFHCMREAGHFGKIVISLDE